MYAIPLNISEPLMGFNLFSIIRVYTTTCMVLVATGTGCMIFTLIASGAKPVILLLDYASDEILTSPTDGGLGRKGERGLMVLQIKSVFMNDNKLGLDQIPDLSRVELKRTRSNREENEKRHSVSPLTSIFNFVCCLPPSSARKGVWPYRHYASQSVSKMLERQSYLI